MIKEIYKNIDNLLSNRYFGRFLADFAQILPISGLKKNILLNKKEIAKKKTYLSSYPYLGILNLTDICNYRCKFCEIHYVFQKYPRQYPNFIDLGILKKYYPLLAQIKFLDFYGATGEPLLNPFFPDIIRFLKSKNPEIYFLVNTNGSFLTDINIKTMVEVGFDEVLISMHAVSEETYHNLVADDYQKVIENIKKLIKTRGNKKKPLIGLAFALNKINAKDALFYPELGKELGVDYIQINHYYHVRNQLSEDVSFYFSPKEGNEIVKEVYRKAKKIGMRIRPSEPLLLSEDYNKNTNLLAEYNKEILNKNYCFHPFTSLKFKGCVECPNSQYITSCNRILLLRMNYKEYSFENPHEDIWNHPAILEMRLTVNTPPYNPICRFCRNKMTPLIRCLNNALYRQFRDQAVEEFLKEVKNKYQIPKIKGIEMLEKNPYE